uniref:Engorgement factor alpha protein n=1 Tax=Haemaphysalis longicornis TaxID=44386 RepID=F6LCB5_HAELO|nr:engorgement factor alpha protein [Haemaphysalis longicornis]
MLITKELIQKGMENKTFCVSLNLAVLKFATHATSAARGGSCDSEAEVGYSEVCRVHNKVPVFDMNWMTASLSDSKQLYTFEKAEMLLSKVLFLKAWFPPLCIATFHTELDTVDATQCPHSAQYERLLAVRKALDAAVHEGNRPWRNYAEDGA